MRAPIVREQTPAVRNGMGLQGLAAAYARTKLDEVAPHVKSLRRDRLADLKAVTLATWMARPRPTDRRRSCRRRCAAARCSFVFPLRCAASGCVSRLTCAAPCGGGARSGMAGWSEG